MVLFQTVIYLSERSEHFGNILDRPLFSFEFTSMLPLPSVEGERKIHFPDIPLCRTFGRELRAKSIEAICLTCALLFIACDVIGCIPAHNHTINVEIVLIDIMIPIVRLTI